MKKIYAIVFTLIFLISNIVCGMNINTNHNLKNSIISKFDNILYKEPQILWESIIDFGWMDYPRYIEQQDDGGYLLVSNSFHNGSMDIALMELDSNGSIISKSFVDIYDDDPIRTIKKTSDDGFLITGSIQNGIVDIVFPLGFYLVKIDKYGNEQWRKVYFDEDFNTHHYIRFNSLKEISNLEFLISGTADYNNDSNDETVLIKMDAFGNIEWELNSETSNLSAISIMLETSDDNIFIVHGHKIIKINESSSLLWEKTYKYSGKILKIFEENDNEYHLIIGKKSDIEKFYFVAIDVNGNELWNNTISKETGKKRINKIMRCTDSGYILASKDYPNYHLIKIDEKGFVQWNRTIESKVENPYFNYVHLIRDNDLGFTFIIGDNWPCWYKLIKFDKNGNELWNKTIKSEYVDQYIPNFRLSKYISTDDFGYLLGGYMYVINEPDWYWDDGSDIYLMKLSGAVLEVKNLYGGFGVSLTLSNVGYDDYSDIDWNISFDGNLYTNNNISGCIESLNTSDSIKIKTNTKGLGFGNMTINIEDFNYKTQVFYLGPLIFINQDITSKFSFIF